MYAQEGIRLFQEKPLAFLYYFLRKRGLDTMDLQEFFKENPKVALAFSGGVDSSYLLYAAMKYGADVKAYYVKALFQPQFEMDDAMRLAEQLKAPVRVLLPLC